MSELEKLTDHRDAISYAAIGALLHNLGKISSKFLKKQIDNEEPDYLYQHILGLVGLDIDSVPQPQSSWQNDYSSEKLAASKILRSDIVRVLSKTFHLPFPIDDRTYRIGDLIEYLGQGEQWYDETTIDIEHLFSDGSRLTHLMNRAHRGASGGEKEDIGTAQQPNSENLFLSTPFGWETIVPSLSNSGDIDGLRFQIEDVINEFLTNPQSSIPFREFCQELQPLLAQAIADTQRPLNDVTVWDIGHTGMAFLVAQVNQWIVTQPNISHDDLAKKEQENNLFWRILSFRTDALRYLEASPTLADLKVRQGLLQEKLTAITEILESSLFAIEIYKDEFGSSFLFPDLDKSSQFYKEIWNQIKDSREIDGLVLTTELSSKLTNHPKDENGEYVGSYTSKLLQQPTAYEFASEKLHDFWRVNPNSTVEEICTACGIRPQGFGVKQVQGYQHNPRYYGEKAIERNICCICMERRRGKAEEWATSPSLETIWLDEVADISGRLALIVGKFDIGYFNQTVAYPSSGSGKEKTSYYHKVRFLKDMPPAGETFTFNGSSYSWNNYLSQLVGEKKISSSFKQNQLTIHDPSQMDITVEDVIFTSESQLRLTVEESLTPQFTIGNIVRCWGREFEITGVHSLKSKSDSAKDKILEGVLWDATHPFIVENSQKVNSFEVASFQDGAHNESFARIRRIWDTKDKFWHDIEDKLKNCLSDDRRRLHIYLKKTPDLGDYHVYDLALGKTNLSVVWHPRQGNQGGYLISADNLGYTARQLGAKREIFSDSATAAIYVEDYLKEQFINQESDLSLRNPESSRQNKKLEKLKVEKISFQQDKYATTIPIMAEPRTFMALLPASQALNIIQTIKTKYEREMGKVRNRLPLHLGVVYAQRRTPLRAILDAGRRMLQYENRAILDEMWTVTGATCTGNKAVPNGLATDTKQFDWTRKIELENKGGERLTWHVPAVMGDGLTPDNWYPYVFANKDVDLADRQFVFNGTRPQNNGSIEECPLVHANELKKDDQIYFTPATFDFQWLSDTAQRFEIAYDKAGKRHNHLTRPYLLDQIAELKQAWKMLDQLTHSQLYALRDSIESKRAEWFTQPQDSLKDETFKQMCCSALRNAKWRQKSKIDVKKLSQWAVSGLLRDVIELQVGIMKKKTKATKQEEVKNE